MQFISDESGQLFVGVDREKEGYLMQQCATSTSEDGVLRIQVNSKVSMLMILIGNKTKLK